MKLITPLNDQEIDKLQLELDAVNAIDVSTLDGLFTALISSPELISPDVWLPIVFQQKHWDESKVPEFQATFSLLVRHLNGIESILSRAIEEFEPIFLERDLHDMTDTVVENWCRGYMKGITLCGQQWKDASKDLQDHLYPFLVFGSNSGKEIQSANNRKQILLWKEQIAPSARAIYRFWLAHRPEAHTPRQPYVKSTEVPGRNDSCHCGSGKKYKRCCGAH